VSVQIHYYGQYDNKRKKPTIKWPQSITKIINGQKLATNKSNKMIYVYEIPTILQINLIK
jgi:hypothetical protein